MKLIFSFIFLLSFHMAMAAGDTAMTTPPTTAVSAETTVSTINENALTEQSLSKEITEAKIDDNKNQVKKESEIPLNLDAKKSIAGSENTFFRFILFFAILGILLAGVWIFLKRNSTKNIAKNHNEIKILAQYYLGPKKSLAVVRIAGESILVGITDHNINLIKALSLLDEELPEVTPNDFNNLLSRNENEQMENVKDQFKSSVKQGSISSTYNRSAVKNNKTPLLNTGELIKNGDIEEDEFSIKGIKDIVSNKLKNMRTI